MVNRFRQLLQLPRPLLRGTPKKPDRTKPQNDPQPPKTMVNIYDIYQAYYKFTLEKASTSWNDNALSAHSERRVEDEETTEGTESSSSRSVQFVRQDTIYPNRLKIASEKTQYFANWYDRQIFQIIKILKTTKIQFFLYDSGSSATSFGTSSSSQIPGPSSTSSSQPATTSTPKLHSSPCTTNDRSSSKPISSRCVSEPNRDSHKSSSGSTKKQG